jgi:hypothetical protein
MSRLDADPAPEQEIQTAASTSNKPAGTPSFVGSSSQGGQFANASNNWTAGNIVKVTGVLSCEL